jgi:transcriptional regulator with XRE-family HTH domain
VARKSTKKLAAQLGARISALRVEAGLTQETLAWDAGFAKPYLSQIEAGKRLPTLGTLKALAERLDVELADLVALDTEEPHIALLEAARKRDRAGVRAALRQLGLG